MVRCTWRFGVLFEMPIVLMFLDKIGTSSAHDGEDVAEAVVGDSALAPLVTPSKDAFTMMMMAVPMVLLYS